MEPLDTILRQIKPSVLGWISSWHAQQGYLLPFGNSDVLGSGISANNGVFSTTVPGAITVASWLQSCYVATTNSGSAYWTVGLYRYQSSSTKIAEINTARISANTWTRFSLTVNCAVPSTDLLIYIYATKTGSPGNLSLAGPMVWVR